MSVKLTRLANEGGEQRARYQRVQRDKGTKGAGTSGAMEEADSVESGRLEGHPCAMVRPSDVKAYSAGRLA